MKVTVMSVNWMEAASPYLIPNDTLRDTEQTT